MDLGIRDKTAFVFGGSRGMVRAIAERLSAEGVAVAIAARTAAHGWRPSRPCAGHRNSGKSCDCRS